MIILDTNVVSEVMRGPHADLRVMQWLRALATAPIGSMDALTAAIARETGSSLATRDIDDFVGLELTLVDPWEVGGHRT